MLHADKPTVQELQDFWYEGRRRDRGLIEQDYEIDAAVFDQAPQRRPRAPAADARFEEIHSRELLTFIEVILGIFKEPPRIHVREIGTSSLTARRASGAENWLNGAIPEVQRQRKQNVLRLGLKDVIKYDRAWWKVHLTTHLWHDRPPLYEGNDKEELEAWDDADMDYRRLAPIPISLLHVHPSSVHGWKDDFGLSNVMEFQKRQVRDIMVGQEKRPAVLAEMKDSDWVWWFEHQNRQWVTYGVMAGPRQADMRAKEKPPEAAKIVIIAQWEHGYGRPSYVFIPGDEHSSMDPKEHFVPIIWPQLELMKQRDMTVAQVATYVRTVSWFYALLELGPDSPPGAKDERTGRPIGWPLEPHMVNVLLPGEKMSAFQPPPLPADTYRLIQWFEDKIQLHGLLPVLQGNVADYSAGYPLNLRSHAARGRYNTIADNYKEGVIETAKLFLQMVVALNQSIYVIRSVEGEGKDHDSEVLEMTVAEAKRPKRIEVQWQLALPTDKALLTRIAMESSRRPSPNEPPLLSKKSAREDILGLEDNEREERLIDRETVRELTFQAHAAKRLERLALAAGPEGGPTAETGSIAGRGRGRVSGAPQAEGSPSRAQGGGGGLVPGQTGGQATEEVGAIPPSV